VTAEFRREFQGYKQRTWAGPVEQLDLTTGLIEMGKWLDSLEDARCQSAHAVTGKASCTVHVTHRSVIDCKGSDLLVCIVHARWNMEGIELGQSCATCGRPASECWKVIPV